jgi:hypothetical protein
MWWSADRQNRCLGVAHFGLHYTGTKNIPWDDERRLATRRSLKVVVFSLDASQHRLRDVIARVGVPGPHEHPDDTDRDDEETCGGGDDLVGHGTS